MLVIIVILALGLLYKFNTAFKAYATALFGGYFACLLETGDLPGVSPECASEFADFSQKNGKQLVNGTFNTGTGGGGGAAAAADKAKANKAGGGGGGVPSSQSRFTVARLGSDNRPATVSLGQVADNKDESGGKNKFGMSGNVVVGRVRQNSGRREVIMMGSHEEEENKKEKEARPQAAKAGKTAEGDSLRPTKSIHTNPIRKLAQEGEEGRTFSIGALVRLLIIILIILALVLLIGGQLMQVARGREKGGD